jgi:phosphoribosyl 1,2-cyclic phosphate phosphodiesterase
MPCYGDERTLADIRKTFHYVFDPATPKSGGLPSLQLTPIEGPLRIGDLEVRPIPVWHGDRAIFGFRFDRVAYVTDCSALADEAWGLLEDLDVLVLDALREQPHPTHLSLGEAVDVARRVGAGRTFFTHMCHHLAHEATNARLPAGMSLAHDGLVLQMPNAKC